MTVDGGGIEAGRWRSSAGSCERSSDRRLRWAYRFVSLVVVVPIGVAAVRDGLRGWEPTWDTATAAVRVRDVFSAHPPLIGLASAASNAHLLYSYPGAIEFYLLAVPTRLFGTTWGLLIGMAAINIAAVAVALWLVRRRVGEIGAIFAGVFISSLLWSLGSEMLIDATPISAGNFVFTTFLVAAWSVADGDDAALVPFALSASFLVLTHPEFTSVVPSVGAVAMALWFIRLLRRRGSSPESSRRAVTIRWVAAAVVATILMWIPSIVDQVAGSGNLAKLAHGSSTDIYPGASVSFASAFGGVASVIVMPRFWFPPSIENPRMAMFGRADPVTVFVATAVVLAVGAAAAGWSIRTKRGSSLGCGLVLAAAAMVGWAFAGVHMAIGKQYNGMYFFSLWPLATFFWFIVSALVVTVARGLIATHRPPIRTGAMGLTAIGSVGVLCFTVFALPRAYRCYWCSGTKDSSIPIAKQLRSAAASLPDSGPVEVDTGLWEHGYLPSILLGLQDAHIPIRVPRRFDVQQFGEYRDAKSHHDSTLKLYLTKSSKRPPGARLVAAASRPPSDMSERRFADIEGRMRAWAARHPDLPLNPNLRVSAARRAAVRDEVQSLLVRARADHVSPVDEPSFLKFLSTRAVGTDGSLFEVPGLTGSHMSDWAADKLYQLTHTYYLYAKPTR